MKKIVFSLLSLSCLIVACNNSGTSGNDKKDSSAPGNISSNMSSNETKAERNRQTALAGVQAINTHDVEAVLKDATADAIDYGDGSMPPVKNIDSVKTFLKLWLTAFPDVKGEHLMALSDADGTNVIVVGEWSATFKNDFMGMKATGKSYKLWDGDLFTFNADGKMTSHRSIQSNTSIMMQVGAKMSR